MRPADPLAPPFRTERLEPRTLFALYGPDVAFADGGAAAFQGNVVLEVLADGDVLAVGWREVPTGEPDAVIEYQSTAVRLNPDGTLDETFGDGGTIDLGRGEVFAHATFTGARLYVQPALAFLPTDDEDPAAEIRAHTLDGRLDPAFAGDGILEGGFSSEMFPAADGGVYLRSELGLDKYFPDGRRDPAFGESGLFPAPPRGDAAVAITTRGILVAQDAPGGGFPDGPMEITRYALDGKAIDATFGDAGTATLPFNFNRLEILEQADGKILLAEETLGAAIAAEFWRLNPDGTPDESFGDAGKFSLADVHESEVFAGWALDADQRIVVVTNHSLYRLTPAGALEDAPFNGEILRTENLGPQQIAFDDEGRILVGSPRTITRYADLAPAQVGRDGKLYVHGDAASETIAVDAAADGTINVTHNGHLFPFDRDDLVGLELRLNAGDNDVTISGPADLPTTVTTGDGDDTITTSGAADRISAAGGNNVIHCGDGAGVIETGDFRDNFNNAEDNRQHVTGGDGDKTIKIAGGGATIELGVGNSVIESAFDDEQNRITIAGGSNKVTLSGEHDVLTIGGRGNNVVAAHSDVSNTVTLGDGNDRVETTGNGLFQTGGGDDSITLSGGGEFNHVTVFAGDGNDWVETRPNEDARATVFGGNGNDRLIGYAGRQEFHGNAGNDTLIGGAGSDLLSAGGGRDRLFGESGADRLYAAAGDDLLFGGPGPDRLFGHDGRDLLYGGSGADFLSGGASGDGLYGQGGDDLLSGDGGDDRLYADYVGASTLVGGAGDDLLVANDGDSGDDALDHLFGSRGRDTALADADDLLSGMES